MNKHIRDYTEELVTDFVDFLLDYQGNCGGTRVLNTDIVITTEDNVTKKANFLVLTNLVQIFMESRDRRIE